MEPQDDILEEPTRTATDPDDHAEVTVGDVLERAPRERSRRIAIWCLPAAVNVLWALYVGLTDQWGRVLGLWRVTVTMVFGSFVAGSTPQGGGAVGFPVLTKVLDVPADVARSFSLSIQAVGMGVAALVIVLAGRRVETRAVLVGGATGILGFMGALWLVGDSDAPFWASTIPGPYVKVTFTLILAAMSYVVLLSLKQGEHGTDAIPLWNARVWTGVVVAGVVGGVASALTGSGVDVFVFLFVVVLAGLHPRVGIPTSILAMAFVSVLGIFVLGVFDGQLFIGFDGTGSVDAVGGQAVAPLDAERFDMFGLWLAAVPVVVWGAPLGTWVAHVLDERRLIIFVSGMAAAEVISTAVFLDELHTNPALLAYGVVGLVASVLVVRVMAAHRHRLLRIPVHDLEWRVPSRGA